MYEGLVSHCGAVVPGDVKNNPLYSLTFDRVCMKALYHSVVTWSTGKMLNITSTQPYLSKGLYKGLLLLCSDVTWSPGKK